MGRISPSFISLLVTVPFALGSIVQMRTGMIAQPSEQDLANLNLFSQWAGSAYCNDDSTPGAAVTCQANVCPDVESHKATIIGSFRDASLTGAEGFVAIDPVQSAIVLSLRGSHSVRNWLTDLVFFHTNCGDTIGVQNCKVHAGFNEAWHNIASSATALIEAAVAANPNYNIAVTGHSFGAAVANIAAANLRASYTGTATMIDLYTFGSPRTGNGAFVDFLSVTNRGRAYRVTHTDDPIPRWPPNWRLIGSYRHVEPEYWITMAQDTKFATVNQVTVCAGTNNNDCNSGTSGSDMAAHKEYFGRILGCAPAQISA